MLTAEFLPLLKKRGLRTERCGVLGWSMGGYGALLLAADRGATQVAADFQCHQVFGRAADLKNVALRIDCGRDDPFAGAVRDLRDELDPAGGLRAGAHTAGYWRRMLGEQFAFLGPKISD